MKSTKEKQYESFYERYADDAYRIALYCLRNEKTSESITEEAFLNFYKKQDGVNPRYEFRNLIQEIICLIKREFGERKLGEEVKENE